eukprot:TRINITY_DN9025_c0_g1_i3.p1 TRINITY_DN9025_c0_g1~~TRINITY_DN9025_c0_g1_i3.p1  ORF type:complete len:371 (+),score=103.46 TRINITY_DN9025_c0_g1_i3:132-1244(+)
MCIRDRYQRRVRGRSITMKLFICAAVLATVLALPPVNHHAARMDQIAEINNKTSLWVAGINTRFAGLPLGASADLCGVKIESHAIVQAKASREVSLAIVGSIPESFDSETNWPECADVIGDIRDQSNCGCCWAFGAASAASDRLCIATKGKTKVPLSAEDVCFCASDDGCGGGDLFSPWEYIQNHGVVTGGNYNGTGALGGGFCSAFSLPHCHHHGPQGSDPYPAEGAPGCPSQSSASCPRKCDADASKAHAEFSSDKHSFKGSVATYDSEAAIQKAIMGQGPVEAAFSVYSDFENYVSGIYHHVSGQMMGGHAIRIVGWGVDSGTKYWKVANSWNPYWGEKGYFRIKRGDSECGIEDQVTANSASATWK